MPHPGQSLLPPLLRQALLLAALAALAAAPAHADCPPQTPRVLLERFIAAPCAACWKSPPPLAREHRQAWVLDWVVPPPPGTPPPGEPLQAFLLGAAQPEAAARMARQGSLASDETVAVSHPLPQHSALDVWVDSTRQPEGRIELHMATRFTSQRPLPAGLQGWMVLVERLPAGDQKSPVARQVVRAVAGPLPMEGLAQAPVAHRRVLNLPKQGDPQQLAALAWVETSKGRVIAAGRGPLPDCPAR